MIAIPNMGMPDTCDMCPIEGCEYINGKFTCPLIEIVQCKECRYWDESVKGHINVGDHLCRRRLRWTMKIDFCSDGERRE